MLCNTQKTGCVVIEVVHIIRRSITRISRWGLELYSQWGPVQSLWSGGQGASEVRGRSRLWSWK